MQNPREVESDFVFMHIHSQLLPAQGPWEPHSPRFLGLPVPSSSFLYQSAAAKICEGRGFCRALNSLDFSSRGNFLLPEQNTPMLFNF